MMVKIIVADDEPTHQEFVATILVRAGHSVISVANGKECLRQLEECSTDLVVADIFMPHLDGIQMLTMMRAQGRRIPVIGMTGGMRGVISPFTDIMSRMGACAVLIKPFSGEYLLRAVQRSLEPKANQEG